MRNLLNSKPFLSLFLVIFMGIGAMLPTWVPAVLHAQHAPAPSSIQQRSPLLQGQQYFSGKGRKLPPNWPEFHGDVQRDGNASSDTMLSKANAASLVTVSGPAFTNSGASMSSPAIYQGLLYYATNKPVGQLEASTMSAVDAMTGETVWSEPFPPCGTFKKGEYVYSSPAVTSGAVNGIVMPEVFIGWGSYSPGSIGCMYDFNARTGALIWTYNTKNSIFSSPAIMSTNTGAIIVAGDNADFVHAFSVNYTGPLGGAGIPAWTYDTRTDQPPPGYAQFCKKSSEKCGDAVWSSPAEGLVLVSGTVHHYAYFGVGAGSNTVGRLDAVDLDTVINNSPALAWATWDPHPSYDNDFTTVLVYNDNKGMAVRVFTSVHDGQMLALDPASGALIFDFNVAARLGNIQVFIHSTGTLVNVNGTLELIFGSGCSPDTHYPTCKYGPNGNIWAIDALSTNINGRQIWLTPNFGGDVVSSPALVNQGANAVVFINGPWYPSARSRGDLLALDPASGSIIADYAVYSGYGAVSSPAIYGGRIFVTVGYNGYINHNPGGGGLAAFRCATCT